MIRHCLIHNEFGVYLGSYLGLGLWSMLDPAGQPCAITFYSVDEIKAFIATWHTPVDQDKIWFAPVTPSDGRYATIADLKRAGLSHMLGDMLADCLRQMPAAGNA